MTLPRVLTLGACQLATPINALVRAEKIQSTWSLSRQETVTCYGAGDAVQVMRLYRGEIDLSEGLRYYAGLRSSGSTVDGPKVDDADVTLIDCNTPIGLCLGDVFINRGQVLMGIYKPLEALAPQLGAMYDKWWHKGVLDGSDEIRVVAGRKLLPYLHVMHYPEVAADILLNMRAVKQTDEDYARSLDELRHEIGTPLGMLTAVYRYLPDGRPLAWPPRHLDMTRKVALDLSIPLFDTVNLVQKYGVATAMNEALTTYRPEFCPLVGEALLGFMNKVMADAPPRVAKPAEAAIPPLAPTASTRERPMTHGSTGDTYFRPEQAAVGTPERDVSDEALAVLRAEAAAKGIDNVYIWFREYYLKAGIGLAPFDVAIADFARKLLAGRRFLEVGAGMGQLAALLAVEGFPAVAMEAHPQIVATTRAVHERICRRFPAAAERFSVINARFPAQAQELIDSDTVVAAINISTELTPQQFADILDAFRPACGVIINLFGFFRPRVTQPEQAELIFEFTKRGFAEPETIYAWPANEYRFQAGRIVYFRNETVTGVDSHPSQDALKASGGHSN